LRNKCTHAIWGIFFKYHQAEASRITEWACI
jgi:hypothetical protein